MTNKPKTFYWAIAYWILFACWLLAGVLNMTHTKGGFFTSYLADLTMPAWLYIVTRGLWRDRTRQSLVQRWFGTSPERAFDSILLGSTITELSSIFWPHGVFTGTFDPLDLLAYFVGSGICYYVEKRTIAVNKNSST